MRVLVDSCIREMDRIGVKGRRNPFAVRMQEQEEVRQSVSKINRAVSVKIARKDSNGCNIPPMEERLRTVNQWRRAYKANSF